MAKVIKLALIFLISGVCASCEKGRPFEDELYLDLFHNRPANYPVIENIRIFEISKSRFHDEAELLRNFDYRVVPSGQTSAFIKKFEYNGQVIRPSPFAVVRIFQAVVYFKDGRVTTVRMDCDSQGNTRIVGTEGSYWFVKIPVVDFFQNESKQSGRN